MSAVGAVFIALVVVFLVFGWLRLTINGWRHRGDR